MVRPVAARQPLPALTGAAVRLGHERAPHPASARSDFRELRESRESIR